MSRTTNVGLPFDVRFCFIGEAADTEQNISDYDRLIIDAYVPYASESGLDIESALAVARSMDQIASDELNSDFLHWTNRLPQTIRSQ